jgi:alkylhydroperoxidase family enzyme
VEEGDEMDKNAFIDPPERIPFYIRIGLMISKRITKKDLLAPKLLAWYPKVAVSSGVLESLVAHGGKDLDERILKLIRIQASMSVGCPFCIDMNSFEYEKSGITEEEMQGLAGRIDLGEIQTLSPRERLALEYAKLISQTPVAVTDEFMEKVKSEFTEREIVIVSSTAAQVNYWARLLIALGVPPEGFSDKCELLMKH